MIPKHFLTTRMGSRFAPLALLKYHVALFRRILFSFSVALFLCLPASSQLNTASPIVHVIRFDGEINPASADYLRGEIRKINDEHDLCAIIQLNTPGGLLSSTREIVADFLGSDVPIIVYVSPGGSRAASAGVFLTLASSYAAMAPGTNIGAAHPVTLQQEMDSTMSEKVTNDAAAFIRSISQQRHRNVEWAEKAVRHSVAISEGEALKEGIIDTVTNSLDSLLAILNGRTVPANGKAVVLTTRGATIVYDAPSVQQTILDILSDPNVAYVLMMLGIWGLMFELYNPGLVFPGIVGVISLVLALYSMNTLPVNYAGFGLIVFALLLFVLDLKLPSHGFLTAGGIASLLLGSMMLFPTSIGWNDTGLSWKIITAVVGTTALFFIFIVGLGVRAQRRAPTMGKQTLVGEIGETLSDLAPEGLVRLHGEIWRASSAEGNIPKSSKVRVEEFNRLQLRVRKSPEN
jgi:membrane-bound serine protease (ClpP class)